MQRLREEYLTWMRTLMAKNISLTKELERLETAEKNDKKEQEGRLEELLQRNRMLEHKNVVLVRELDWLQSRGNELLAAENPQASTRPGQLSTRPGQPSTKPGAAVPAKNLEAISAMIRSVAESQGSESATMLIARATSAFDMEEKAELVLQLAAELDPEFALHLRAALLAPMGIDQVKRLVEELQTDDTGAMWCVNMRAVLEGDANMHASSLKRLLTKLFKSTAPRQREDALRALLSLLTNDECQALCRDKLEGETSRSVAPAGAAAVPPRIARRPTFRRSGSGEPTSSNGEATRGAAAAHHVAKKSAAEVAAVVEAEAYLAAKGIPGLLNRRPLSSKRMGVKEILRFVSGATLLKISLDVTHHQAPQTLPLSDALWQWINRTYGREESFTQLRNLCDSCTAQLSKEQPVLMRIKAFCHITGIGVSAADVWGPQKSQLYLTTLSYLLPEADRGYEQTERELASEVMPVPTAQAENCVNTLVTDYGTLQDLRRRVADPGADEIKLLRAARASLALGPAEATTASSAASFSGPVVSLDWLLEAMMQEWDDALIPAKQKLRKGFKNANVGDGVFNLSSFGNMVRDIRGVRDDLSDIIIFNIFDDSIRMSELILGHESEGISPDAFVRCALDHDLLKKTQAAFALIPPAPVAPNKPIGVVLQDAQPHKPFLGAVAGPVSCSLRNLKL